MAPEVFDGSYTNKCDIWSCGIIMHVLIQEDFPFDLEENKGNI